MTPTQTTPHNPVSLGGLAAEIAARGRGARIIVALAGAPGSGKSTTAEALKAALEQDHGQSVQVVPMDGFHFDDAVLAELGRGHRKGAPDTFDVGGLEMTLARLARAYQVEDVAVPVFDRSMELSRASARLISQDTRIVLVEGNYLLLAQEPWSRLGPYFDLTAMIACDETTLRNRLMARWLGFGYSQEEASRKVEGNDLPNARRVIHDSNPATFTLIQ